MQDSEMSLFPYKDVEKGSKIIIYGAGKVGQCFLQQIQSTDYCRVVCITDKKYRIKNNVDGVCMCAPQNIDSFEYDKIVIAIESKMVAREIRRFLVKDMHIDEKKIICNTYKKFALDYPMRSLINPNYKKESHAYGDNKLSVAFFVGDGLGDCIIAKCFITEFIKLIKCKYVVDLYGKNEYIKAVFSDVENLNNIFSAGEYEQQSIFYDVSILVTYVLSITMVNILRIRRFDYHLATKISKMKEGLEHYGVVKSGDDYSIHFARCKKLNLDAYTAFNINGVIQIQSNIVSIPLIKKYEMDFCALQLKQYITLNFGWGLNPKSRIPAKVWPSQHYEALIKYIKEKYPGLGIVQLGVRDSKRLGGVDHYVFGKSLELSKYVLKNSLLHIDCEGGLVHLATQLHTKCIVLFGPTPMHYFGYKNNINIVSEKCNDCCYLDNDFSICYRGLEKPECMYSISPEKVFTYIQEYLQDIVF